ncbi:hypothetical protein [Dyadobacter sp. 3J3]|uniref:hypothetical protein n=1 Tax=Dyadobacter sp. 3J3 TaxID=2606600 RepID=UPI001358F638|nr:hypothetical protein [Dyadobacter sp. 3J3]
MKNLKKVISISLLVIYFFSTTQLVELVKLPVLFEHYQQHKAWDEEVTFFEFIYEHYAESINGNPDKDLDMKLPFKSHLDQTALSFLVTPPASTDYFYFKVAAPVFFSERHYFIYSEGPLISSYLSTIWQPPKFC